MRGKFGRLIVTAVLTAGLVISAAAVNAATYTVKASNEDGGKWKPGTSHIYKNDRIVWKNPTNTLHDIKAYGGNWSYKKSLPPGEKRAKRFRKRGTFKYRCVLHSAVSNGKCSGMCGVIHVM